jgi:hypothetical protein
LVFPGLSSFFDRYQNIEASARTVLEEFKDLFEKYWHFVYGSSLRGELNLEHAAIGLPPQVGGIKGQSRPTTATENVAILMVVCVLMYNCCMQRLVRDEYSHVIGIPYFSSSRAKMRKPS